MSASITNMISPNTATKGPKRTRSATMPFTSKIDWFLLKKIKSL